MYVFCGLFFCFHNCLRKMTATLKKTRICKHCGGSGSHMSNVSRTRLKCHSCRGTGNLPKSLVTYPEVQEKWLALSEDKKNEIYQRMAVAPQIILKPSWKRVIYFPSIWWQHYKISKKTLPTIRSLRFTTLWTVITVFPSFALKIMKRKFDK